LTQTELRRQLTKAGDQATSRHIYNLQLNPSVGPYGLTYDRSGRYAGLFGQGGHVAIMDCYQQTLQTEFHLPNERIRDFTFLHNHTLAAVAQKNHVFIYDNTGTEVHKLEDHQDPMALQFLPYIGRARRLKYQDT
jgi:U3 small nucleolar RNA-associated protein 7